MSIRPVIMGLCMCACMCVCECVRVWQILNRFLEHKLCLQPSIYITWFSDNSASVGSCDFNLFCRKRCWLSKTTWGKIYVSLVFSSVLSIEIFGHSKCFYGIKILILVGESWAAQFLHSVEKWNFGCLLSEAICCHEPQRSVFSEKSWSKMCS